MSHIMRKPVYAIYDNKGVDQTVFMTKKGPYEPRQEKTVGVCDQVRLKPACAATETS